MKSSIFILLLAALFPAGLTAQVQRLEVEPAQVRGAVEHDLADLRYDILELFLIRGMAPTGPINARRVSDSDSPENSG